jgi:hypothetical protein
MRGSGRASSLPGSATVLHARFWHNSPLRGRQSRAALPCYFMTARLRDWRLPIIWAGRKRGAAEELSPDPSPGRAENDVLQLAPLVEVVSHKDDFLWR